MTVIQGYKSEESRMALGDQFLEYGLAMQNTTAESISPIAYPDTSFLIRDNDYRLLEIFDTLAQTHAPEPIHDVLRKIKKLLASISAEMRLTVLRRFNLFLHNAEKKHAFSSRLFTDCLDIILELKRQRDLNKLQHNAAAKLEWVELEKAVYHLSVWEDHIQQTNMACTQTAREMLC